MQVIRQLSTWIIVLLIFISRLPFVTIGYGAEEDAWGLRVTAENIYRTGIYEVSRLPGHPFQELIFSQCWQYGPLTFNIMTLLLSTTGIFFFMLSLKKLNVANYKAAGLALAFTPVIYINSMNAMDYTWAMSFILIAFYFLIVNKNLWAGVFLGCAIGCRITSGAMLIPFIYFILTEDDHRNKLREVALICFLTLITAAILFLPVYRVYGALFFSFYEHFPVPSFTKNLYKGTIGVWGLIGFISMLAALLFSISSVLRNSKFGQSIFKNRIFIFSFLIILLYILSFCRLPLKSAFIIPLIPFLILIIAQNLKEKRMSVFTIAMIFSCFAFGVNLSDPNRGSAESGLAVKLNIGNQQVSIDPLIGPVIADYTKQKKMISYSTNVITETEKLKGHSVIISGWYLNFIIVLQQKNNEQHEFVYYVDEAKLHEYKSKGFSIYYLAGQNKFNDLRFNGSFTDQYAEPLEITVQMQ